MSGTITMFDSISAGDLPAGDGYAYAGYVDGRFANVAEIRDRFPGAHVLSIAVFAEHDADCLDIETGDATPEQAAAWFLRQKTRGAARPCLYASAFVMDTQVLPAIRAAGISRETVRLWSAHYTGSPHRCGPASCRELGTDADGTQWTDRALGRNLDQSLLADDFFGTAPAPHPPAPAQNWTQAMIGNLPLLIQGNTGDDVRTLQGLLIARGHPVKVDGAFGSLTWQAVLRVQQAFSLTQDGKVGQATWTALVTRQHG